MEYYLTSIDPAANRYRFYTIFVQYDLFGNVFMKKHCGRIGSRGRSKSEVYTTLDEAYREIAHVLKRRRQNGYEIIEKSNTLLTIKCRTMYAVPAAAAINA